MAEPDYKGAYDRLSAAIHDYYAEVDPSVFLDGWVLILHKRTPELESERNSAVGVIADHESSWITVRALIDIAYQREKDNLRRVNNA